MPISGYASRTTSWARTVTVSDNGIGMSRDESRPEHRHHRQSGTREFFQALNGDQAKMRGLIGQFGVGFYSSFIVADRYTLLTRRADLPGRSGGAMGVRRAASSRSSGRKNERAPT